MDRRKGDCSDVQALEKSSPYTALDAHGGDERVRWPIEYWPGGVESRPNRERLLPFSEIISHPT